MANWLLYAAALGLVSSGALSAYAQETSGVAAPAEKPTEHVVLEADYIYEIREENSVVAEGNVEALYEGRVLRADRIIYNKTTDRVRATGNVVIVDTDGSQQFADEVEVNSDLADGYAIGFSARLPEGATIVANSGIRKSNGVNALEQVIYTSCELCGDDTTPTWSLRARRAVLDTESQMISYRDVVLEVGSIPVFYLPYLSHPDPTSDRRSGFLVPSGGLSSKLGAFYQQPYYWAISPSQDLTISPMVSANVNPMVELDYRKRFYSGGIKINSSITREADFDSDGVRFGDEKWRGHIYGKGLFAISPEWKWGFGVETQSDDLYDRRYDISGQGERRGLYTSQPRRLMSQLFAVGQGDSYYTDIAVLDFQGLRGSDDSRTLPTVAPVAFTEKYWDLGDYGFAAVNASSAMLTRESGLNSQRVSVGGDWSDLNVLPGGFTFEPFAEIRGDYYALNEDVSGEPDVSRAVGNAGARVSYPLVRPGKIVDIMVEPTVMAAWGFSNVNGTAIPIEDSILYEFDEGDLFEANGFGNYDLYEGDGKLAAGVTARAVFRNGPEFATTLGRRWRSRTDPNFDVASNLDGTSSDWVGSASADFGRALRVDTRVRLDDDGYKLNRIDARLSTSYKRLRGVAQYYNINERISPLGRPDEGIFMRGEFQVTKRYSLIFGQLRDIVADLNARREFGIAYEDDCSRFELVYQRSELNDRTLGPSESIQFRFSLKSIGDFGSSEFD